MIGLRACRSWRDGFDIPLEGCSGTRGGTGEVRHPDSSQSGGMGCVVRQAAPRDRASSPRADRGTGRLRGAGRVGGAGRSVAGPDGAGTRIRHGGQRRAVRRGEGVPGRLLPHRVRESRPGRLVRRAAAARAALPDRGAAGDEPEGTAGAGVVVGPTVVPGVDVDSMERLLRELAPQVLAVLVRRHGDFDTCEDAVREALLAAAVQWPADGVPTNPLGWLLTVGSRRWIEVWRNEAARRRREQSAALLLASDPRSVPAVDDTLTLFMLCCHPALTLVSQVALTLRAVGGLSTAEIARGLLVPEATERVAAVLSALYLIFHEGYTASPGSTLHRPALTGEAIRLTRQLHTRLPDHGEAAGLLALMLLTDARRPARTDPDGGLIPLAEQDRSRWDRRAIAEGTDLLERTLARSPVGPYQLQAAIAAVHAQATRPEDTDWPQILELYELLHVVAPGPMVTLNRIVAAAMVHGPHTGLRQLTDAETEPVLAEHYRIDAIRAHLLDMAGDHDAARTHYQRAARRTLSLPEQRYLESRASRRRLTGQG